jgi:uncharacterized protein
MSLSYEESILQIRKAKDGQIKANPLHWLNLAGLFWLEEGDNPFGSDAANKISHPAFPHPFCGSFHLANGQVTFHPAVRVTFTSNHADSVSRPLITDHNPEPDMIEVGALTMKVIIRGGSRLIRMWDRESPAKAQFHSLQYYPVKEEYRVTAKYIRYETPKTVKKMEVIGTETQVTLLGEVHFDLHGTHCSLLAEKSGDELLLHFADKTNAKTTYGGGRRIYIAPPASENFTLDLNLVDNWPCAYTPYATCPITPTENRLSIPIEAGELNYHK